METLYQQCQDNINETDLLGENSISNSNEFENSEHEAFEPENEAQNNFLDTNNNIKDGIVVCYEDFDDSVYDVAWSNSDPWIYMAASFDGRLVLSHVPKDIKYSILL